MSEYHAITKQDAARITGLSMVTIKHAIRKGELEGVRLFGRVFVNPASLEAFMARRRERREAKRPKVRSGSAGQFKRFKQWQRMQQ